MPVDSAFPRVDVEAWGGIFVLNHEGRQLHPETGANDGDSGSNRLIKVCRSVTFPLIVKRSKHGAYDQGVWIFFTGRASRAKGRALPCIETNGPHPQTITRHWPVGAAPTRAGRWTVPVVRCTSCQVDTAMRQPP
jgi:hypothetical protein